MGSKRKKGNREGFLFFILFINWRRTGCGMFRRRPIASSCSVEFGRRETGRACKKRIPFEFGLSLIMRERRQALRHFLFSTSFRLKRRDSKGTFFRCFGSSVGREIRRAGSQRISFGDFIKEKRRRNRISGRWLT